MRRIIQVGVGGMGGGWTDRVAESRKWTAAAYVDVNPDVLAKTAEKHGIAANCCFRNLDEALRNVEADAVLDITPQQFRKSVCCRALEAGLDVLAEKPMADTLANAKAIVDCARENGRTFMIAQNYRYQPLTQTARQFISDGGLGEVGYVGVSFHKGPKFGGYREEMRFPLVLDMSIHHFDMMRCMLGGDIVSVLATSIGAPWNWFKGDATVIADLEIDNGVHVNYYGSWVARGWETPWNADWRFSGSKGVLLWEQDKLMFSNEPGQRKRMPLLRMPKVHQAYLLEAFANYLDAGQEPETSGRGNLNSLAATYAAVRSSEEGRRVKVSELLQ
jgi:predicted dehydrogenase